MSLLCPINPPLIAGIEEVYLDEHGRVCTTDREIQIVRNQPMSAVVVKGEAFATLDVGLLYLANFIWGTHMPEKKIGEICQYTLVLTDSSNPSFKNNVTVLDENHKKILELSNDTSFVDNVDEYGVRHFPTVLCGECPDNSSSDIGYTLSGNKLYNLLHCPNNTSTTDPDTPDTFLAHVKDDNGTPYLTRLTGKEVKEHIDSGDIVFHENEIVQGPATAKLAKWLNGVSDQINEQLDDDNLTIS